MSTLYTKKPSITGSVANLARTTITVIDEGVTNGGGAIVNTFKWGNVLTGGILTGTKLAVNKAVNSIVNEAVVDTLQEEAQSALMAKELNRTPEEIEAIKASLLA